MSVWRSGLWPARRPRLGVSRDLANLDALDGHLAGWALLEPIGSLPGRLLRLEHDHRVAPAVYGCEPVPGHEPRRLGDPRDGARMQLLSCLLVVRDARGDEEGVHGVASYLLGVVARPSTVSERPLVAGFFAPDFPATAPLRCARQRRFEE